MSAATELLLEQIEQLETTIRHNFECGLDTQSMSEELKKLRARLVHANQALHENKQILKG